MLFYNQWYYHYVAWTTHEALRSLCSHGLHSQAGDIVWNHRFVFNIVLYREIEIILTYECKSSSLMEIRFRDCQKSWDVSLRAMNQISWYCAPFRSHAPRDIWPRSHAKGEAIMAEIEGDPRERHRPKAKMTPELKYSWGRCSCSRGHTIIFHFTAVEWVLFLPDRWPMPERTRLKSKYSFHSSWIK